MQSTVREVVIAGAGAAAGATAAAAAVSLQGSGIAVTLLLLPHSVVPGSVDVIRGGPRGLHTLLGIDESVLFGQTGAVYGMGTRYRGLLASGEDAFVPLGAHGKTLRLVDFHHYVAKLRAEDGPQDYNAWSVAAAAAKKGRFDPAQTGVEPALRLLDYDLYVDHDSYRDAMLAHASSLGVRVVRQSPADVTLDAAGTLESITLADASTLRGDFFIDCSEDRALLRHVAADDAFDDWTRWFACDRMVSLSAKARTTPDLHASIEADDAGWLSQLSTRATTTTTFIYDSAASSDTEAVSKLLSCLSAADGGGLMPAGFKPGRYASHWKKNCVAIGPATAVPPPMEVSPLQLTHSAILRLLAMLPRHRESPMLAAEFNRVTNAEIDGVRDYQLLRLALTDRKDGRFWQRKDQAQWPESLQQRIDLFRSRGRFTPFDDEFFAKPNWISSFISFGLWPASYDPLADMVDERRMRADVQRFREVIATGA